MWKNEPRSALQPVIMEDCEVDRQIIIARQTDKQTKKDRHMQIGEKEELSIIRGHMCKCEGIEAQVTVILSSVV